jgi:hypothetical protein
LDKRRILKAFLHHYFGQIKGYLESESVQCGGKSSSMEEKWLSVRHSSEFTRFSSFSFINRRILKRRDVPHPHHQLNAQLQEKGGETVKVKADESEDATTFIKSLFRDKCVGKRKCSLKAG